MGDEIKTPWSLSFSWIVNELKGLGWWSSASYDPYCWAGWISDIFVQGFIKDHHKVCLDCSS